ncbi:hypothetical protein [Metabacillus litoralis]|uniref:DUF4376 domain-containing protein n=1 Tax=Metabacillus litoralis TaxID=152268 RepID=UPI00203AEAE1|nr:hypothetical protein [Metabacillus litoralis]MCM3413510.1 hypothetical protein [Metabacillus litoralis]
MRIGRRIYYDIKTGSVLAETGEHSGAIYKKTIEEDISTFKILTERNRESFEFIDLPFGAYKNEFSNQENNYRVNPTTQEMEFNYDFDFSLQQYKAYKISELSVKCQEDIYNGFTSKLNFHTYRTNNDDQLNFLGKFNQLSSNGAITSVMWKTEDVGYFEHTRDEWLTIYGEALTAKEQKLFKYDQLKQQVEVCTTKEEVEAIVW